MNRKTGRGLWDILLLVALACVLWAGDLRPAPTTARAQNENPAATTLMGVVGSLGANLYDIPDGAPFRLLSPATTLTVIGRAPGDLWLQVQLDDGTVGWLPRPELIIFGIETLPLVEPDAATPPPATTPVTPPVTVPQSVPVASTAPITETATTDTGTETLTGTASETASVDAAEETALPPTASPELATELDTEMIAGRVNLTGSRLNVRAGPGTSYPILAKAQPGDLFVVRARSADAAWLLLDLSNEEQGWVSAEYITLTAPIDSLPTSEWQGAAPAPAPVSTAPVTAPAPRTAATAAPASSGLHGTLVIQTEPGGAIYAHNLATGDQWYLADGFDPAISPDGRTVAFTRTGGENGLYLVDIDGSNLRRIFSGLGNLRSPGWSPDGQYIVFSRAAEGDFCRLVSEGFCISDSPLLEDYPLVQQNSTALSRVDRNGDSYQDVPALNGARNPNWTVAGIVYEHRDGLEITQDAPAASTANVIKLTHVQAPAHQPNGDRILYQHREGGHWEIFAVSADGSGKAAYTRPASVLVDQMPSNVAPAWSPDGQQIAFLSNRIEGGEAGEWRIWAMNADGSNQRPLPIDLPLTYTFTGERMLSWGP